MGQSKGLRDRSPVCQTSVPKRWVAALEIIKKGAALMLKKPSAALLPIFSGG
jgi:hypothetical protein